MKRVFEMSVGAFAVIAVPAMSFASTFVNDTFRDADRTDPASPVYSEYGVDSDVDADLESAWYTSNAGGVTMTPGHFNQATASGSTSWQTYFAPEAAPITLGTAGDTMKLTWVFSMSGVANDGTDNTGQNFRLAVVNSPSANRLVADGAPGNASGGDYDGYAMFMNIDQTLRRSTPFNLKKRSATGAFLSASNTWGTSLVDDGNTNDPGYTSDTTYTYTMTLTRNAANGLDIVSRMEGAGLGAGNQGFLEAAATDATPAGFSFDMFGLRPSASATSATAFDTTLFRVEATLAPVPEPTSIALGLFGAALLRRRR